MAENNDIIPKWNCHLHPSSKFSCSLVYEFVLDDSKKRITNSLGTYFHVVEVKDVDKSASFLNERNISNEFWENLGSACFVTAIAYSNWICYEEVINHIFDIFRILDEKRWYYTNHNTPNDFIKQHLIVDPTGHITLCNKHLIKQNKAEKPRYSTISWQKRILKALYPKLISSKNKISTDIPTWVTLRFNKSNMKKL